MGGDQSVERDDVSLRHFVEQFAGEIREAALIVEVEDFVVERERAAGVVVELDEASVCCSGAGEGARGDA